MIRRLIHTDEKPALIRLHLAARRPVRLILKARDPMRSFSDYMSRRVPLRGARTVDIPLPVSPKRLEILLWEESGGGFSVEGVERLELKANEHWAQPQQHRFMAFAVDFAQKAGHAKLGFHSSPKDEFLIQYLPSIRDDSGKKLVTPARINRLMPRIQVSREQFRRFSIPVRVAILAHEGCHYFLDTRSETEADLCGLRHYLALGFPRIEAAYALTKVFGLFPDSLGPDQIGRVQKALDFLQSAFPKPQTLDSWQK